MDLALTNVIESSFATIPTALRSPAACRIDVGGDEMRALMLRRWPHLAATLPPSK